MRKDFIENVALMIFKSGENATDKQIKAMTKFVEKLMSRKVNYNPEGDYTLDQIIEYLHLFIKEY